MYLFSSRPFKKPKGHSCFGVNSLIYPQQQKRNTFNIEHLTHTHILNSCSLQRTIMIQASPMQRGIASVPIPLPHAAGLRPHDHQVGSDAGTSHVGRHDAAGVTQTPLHRQRVALALVCGRWGRQGAGWTEVGADALVVVGGHFQRQAGDHEKLVEYFVDAIVSFCWGFNEGATGVLAFAVGLGLVHGYGSTEIIIEKIIPPTNCRFRLNFPSLNSSQHSGKINLNRRLKI